MGRYLIAGISLLLALFVTKNFLVWAALAACLVIFAFPCVLLGTVTPSLTRFTVDNLDDTGKTVGRLNALNTIGSIIGTFVPTFVTIPAVGTAATFLIFSGVLAAIGIAYFVFEKKKSVPGIVSVLLIAGLCFALPSYSFAFWQSDITLEDESIYNYLQVQDDAKRTTLSTNVLFGVQSVQVKGDALTGMYYDYALAAPCMAGMDGTDNENRSVMILGMGAGTILKIVAEGRGKIGDCAGRGDRQKNCRHRDGLLRTSGQRDRRGRGRARVPCRVEGEV